MKIITENAVYVMKNDIGYLNQTDIAIPTSIYLKVFGDGIVIINDSNRYEFVKFDSEKEIEFFKGIDWMIDYTALKDLSIEEINEIGQGIADTRNAMADQFNKMSDAERDKNRNMIQQIELLDFKIYSLRDYLLFRLGRLAITLPDGIDYPKDNNKEEKKNNGQEENVIAQQLKKRFRSSKQKK